MKAKLLAGTVAAILVLGAGVAWRAGLFGGRALRVGTILPLSGPSAAIGHGMQNSIRMAVADVNSRGGLQGRRVELVELDETQVPAQAEAAANQLAADPSVVAVLAHYDGDCSAATQVVMNAARLPNLVVAVPNREMLSLTRTSTEFRILPLGEVAMNQAAKHAWEILGARSFIYVRDDSNFGLSMVNQIRRALTPYFGHTVTGEVMVRAGELDFSALVKKVRDEHIQYVFFGGGQREAALLLTQLRAAGVTAWFQTAAHEPSQEFIDVAKADAEGAITVFHGLPTEDLPGGRAFLAAYAAKGFAEPPGAYGLYAYAAAQALLGAMERSFLTRPSITGALGNERLDTALGPIKFHYLGSTYQTAAVYRVVKGKWTPVFATDATNKLVPYVAR